MTVMLYSAVDLLLRKLNFVFILVLQGPDVLNIARFRC
jgi:hypothetical protein